MPSHSLTLCWHVWECLTPESILRSSPAEIPVWHLAPRKTPRSRSLSLSLSISPCTITLGRESVVVAAPARYTTRIAHTHARTFRAVNCIVHLIRMRPRDELSPPCCRMLDWILTIWTEHLTPLNWMLGNGPAWFEEGSRCTAYSRNVLIGFWGICKSLEDWFMLIFFIYLIFPEFDFIPRRIVYFALPGSSSSGSTTGQGWLKFFRPLAITFTLPK